MVGTAIRSPLLEVGQIAMTAHDLPRAIAFYRDTLGLPLLYQAPALAFFGCGGVRLMLALPEEPEFDHPGSIVYYRTGDIRSAYQYLTAAGVQFRDAPHCVARMPEHELWMAFFHDSEGNTLALMSQVRP